MTFTTFPEIAYAGKVLERHSLIFGHNFNNGNAVDVCAQLICDLLEQDEDWEHLVRPVIDTSGYREWT